jgi:AmmeMemoRadiSam system protein B
MESTGVRQPSQAGRFYPSTPADLRGTVEPYLESAPLQNPLSKPIGFVAPHAGYPFSGPTAGHVYRQLRELDPEIVFVIAPSHYASFPLASIWHGTAYATPLGECPIDRDMVAALREKVPEIKCREETERREHSLEVQVPFLQIACPQARLVPLLIGDQEHANIRLLAEGVYSVCSDVEAGRIAFVASSDAYHGYSLADCKASDRRLAEDLESLDVEALYNDVRQGVTMACGRGPIALTMILAKRMGASRGTILHQSTSADTVPHNEGDYVVGYLGAMFL